MALRAEGDVRPRTVFYARCGALEDLAYGLGEPAPAYAAKAARSLAWLFDVDASRADGHAVH